MPLTRREREERMALQRPALEQFQFERLHKLFGEIFPANAFYSQKLEAFRSKLLQGPLQLQELRELPFTTKSELIGSGDYAANLTWPIESYVRFHRTSGTHGKPLAVLDTTFDWDWWCESWQYVLDQAQCESGDRAMMAFSFGPFIGFWSAFDAATRRGMLVAPGGGLSTAARLGLLQTFRPRVVFCTPSYAQYLADEGLAQGVDLKALGVERLIVAGEPGGSVPGIRQALEASWNASVIDHAGATEVGAWGFGDVSGSGIYVNETEFIAEIIDRETLEPVAAGELGELVLTSLGRCGAPVIRYRTGDMVRGDWDSQGKCRFVHLVGGVLGRADDMLIVRGVNVFPASIDAIVQSFESIGEYRLKAHKRGAMDALTIEIEDRDAIASELARAIEVRVGLKVEIQTVPLGSLPRSDGKAKRFVDRRDEV